MNYYFVYILTNEKHSVFYTGITSDLVKRIYEHKHKIIKGFTAKYSCSKLVWYRFHNNVNEAIADEKRIKRWKRVYKIDEINKMNPAWNDLYPSLLEK
ncbi:MAG: GIY-YIG nuclease family protein [Calditrichaeota bacterium]|nr:GIY-YIG nuclease family protein [Calditrichota bacterium]